MLKTGSGQFDPDNLVVGEIDQHGATEPDNMQDAVGGQQSRLGLPFTHLY